MVSKSLGGMSSDSVRHEDRLESLWIFTDFNKNLEARCQSGEIEITEANENWLICYLDDCWLLGMI